VTDLAANVGLSVLVRSILLFWLRHGGLDGFMPAAIAAIYGSTQCRSPSSTAESFLDVTGTPTTAQWCALADESPPIIRWPLR